MKLRPVGFIREMHLPLGGNSLCCGHACWLPLSLYSVYLSFMKTGSFAWISVNIVGAIAMGSFVSGGSAQAISPTTVALEAKPYTLSQRSVEALPLETEPTLTPQSLPTVLPIQPSQLRQSDTFDQVFPRPVTPLMSPVTSPTIVPATSLIPTLNNQATLSPSEAIAIEEDYRLGAGDTIQLRFFNVSEYDGTYQLSTDGSVTLPLVGRVPLTGLNLAAAGDRISSAYTTELRYPQVEIDLIARRPLQVVITGEIVQPGLYVFPSDVSGQAPRLFQALQTAGGITQTGDLENIRIIRDDPVPSLSQTIAVNLFALLQNGDLTQNIDLRDGDVISIPPTKTLNAEKIRQLDLSNVRPEPTQPVDIAVIGEVEEPGPYRFSPGEQAGIVQAIQEAGGLSPFADVRQVLLERRTRDGSLQKINIDLFAILETGRIDQDVPLQKGDVITIPTTELSNSEVSAIISSTLASGPIEIAVLGEVESPGALEVLANTSLNQAILAVGGFNDLARKEVKLLRFNPDGTVAKRKIDVDLERTINSEDNPILRPNDIVMVGKSTWGSIKDTLASLSRNISFFTPFLFFLSNP
ncbi:MAG: sugar ABC transporter substrate-binding protein [Limnothrix sp. RL_2_0]|nr:sugar ABC transporter substrate-binding protein [Limnothrix sp. RL_2_0]